MGLGIRASQKSRPLISHSQGLGRRAAASRQKAREAAPCLRAPAFTTWQSGTGVFTDEMSGMTSGEGPVWSGDKFHQ
jgi:uncharacterized MAPEG superfamily protein